MPAVGFDTMNAAENIKLAKDGSIDMLWIMNEIKEEEVRHLLSFSLTFSKETFV